MLTKKILEWFVHPKLQQAQLTYTRAKTLASTGIIAAAAIPVFAALYYWLGDTLGAGVCLAMGGFIGLALLLLKWFGNFEITQQVVIGAVYLGLTCLSYNQGGLITPATYWLIMPPIIAVFLGSMRHGLWWFAISLITVAVFWVMARAHFILPVTPITDVNLLTACSIAGLAAVILALTYYFETAKIMGFLELEKAAATIKEKSAALLQMNQELSRLASRTEAILAAAADGIIATDARGMIETHNQAVVAMFGYSTEELIGKNLQMLFTQLNAKHEKTTERLFSLKHILDTSDTLLELIGFCKQGKSFPLELAISKIVDKDQRVIYICVIRDMTERKKTEERLAYLAHYDHLTGLPNRTLYETLLNNALKGAKQHAQLCAVLYFDLDYFKNVNDTLGHDIGDLLLKEVALRISKCLQPRDAFTRLGGDEFTVILTELVDMARAGQTAQAILNAFNAPFILNGYEIFTSASIGIAVYPLNGQDVTTLTKHADMALYTAKEQGRHKFAFFDAELNSQNLARIAIETNLHNAIRLNEFEIYYQPQQALKSGQITGIEALVRWHNPALGVITPDIFIPIAEKIGLIAPIGEWVIKNALQQFKQWQTGGLVHDYTKIALNLSSVQLRQENLPATLMQLLCDMQFSPAHIVLELTETTIMQDQKSAINSLRQLDELGISIAIDDFGTGYSSLSYLKCLPVRMLKIDRAFVRDLGEDHDDALIVKAIIALGHGLELTVLAEGVENAVQVDYLAQNECDEIQGYYVSQPLTATAMTAFLSSRIKH